MLHAARSRGSRPDIELAWDRIGQEERDAVRALADRLDAGTALAAGLGELGSVGGDRTAELWRYYSGQGGTRLGEWKARWYAAESLRERRAVVAGALVVNR